MAKKSGSRLVHKETGTQNKKQNNLPDEITLRDEIFELKRQVMILKRTNEQYLVKLRKYEDEAKRKDKQLEHLMDPRKNSDITKVLSTKGAAILMNLKEQNNTLIQMILNKDLHIRRLMAEIKMSKLYASTKKSESYRAEISRLRNLLIKSQETLKENVDVQEQSRSICVSGNSFLEFSSSSDQSSPRDLDELRLTILSLESHIQQSNDLLAKKNQEIALLKDEVKFLKRFFCNKLLKNKSYNWVPTEPKDYEIPTPDTIFRHSEGCPPSKILKQDVIHLFHKNTDQKDENLLNPAQDFSQKWVSSIDSISKPDFQSYVIEETTELIETKPEDIERISHSCMGNEQMGKSLFHQFVTDEIKREEKIVLNLRTFNAKEKWKKALNKYKEFKKLYPQMFDGSVKDEELYQENKNEKNEIPDKEKKLQKTGKMIENYQTLEKDHTNREGLEKSSSPDILIKQKTPRTLETNNVGDKEVSETCQNSINESWKDERNYETEDIASVDKTHTRKDEQQKEPQCPDINHKGFASLSENSDPFEEIESRSTEPFREICYHSLDSSSDSECSYSVNQGIRQVQVEVEINSFSSQSDNDQTGNNISETNQFNDYKENNGNHTPELDFNDDDDVIIREK